MSRLSAALRARVRSLRSQVRERGTSAMTRGLRLTGAAVASYLVALGLVTDARPVTAALTALLVVQVTLVGTVTDTMLRIVSVVLGVGLAIGFASVAPFTWWSLGLVVALSIALGQFLRLGDHLLEVPISAMLILAVGGAGLQAVDRVEETVIGAVVGLLVNILFPPAVQNRSAGAAVEQFADRVARLLDRVAEALSSGDATRDDVRSWLHEARAITNELDRVDRVLTEADRSRRLNPRAVGTADTTPDLRDGLDALEHSAVALRAVFRSVSDRVDTATASREEPVALRDSDLIDDDLRAAFATLMADLAQAFRCYGTLVRAEVDAADEPHTVELAQALDSVREARVRLTELLFVDPQESPGLWQLHGSLLAGIERVLAELDVEERARRRERRRRELAERRAGTQIAQVAQAADRLRQTTRKAVQDRPPLPLPRRRPR